MHVIRAAAALHPAWVFWNLCGVAHGLHRAGRYVVTLAKVEKYTCHSGESTAESLMASEGILWRV